MPIIAALHSTIMTQCSQHARNWKRQIFSEKLHHFKLNRVISPSVQIQFYAIKNCNYLTANNNWKIIEKIERQRIKNFNFAQFFVVIVRCRAFIGGSKWIEARVFDIKCQLMLSTITTWNAVPMQHCGHMLLLHWECVCVCVRHVILHCPLQLIPSPQLMIWWMCQYFPRNSTNKMHTHPQLTHIHTRTATLMIRNVLLRNWKCKSF